MVHIKRVELSHFKSFGGTTQVPLLPGFTVVSGPNGSGKSNILDALLFALGLASSRGMRAERLPDLVNHKYSTNHNTKETTVSVTFDLSGEGFELPVKKQGSEEQGAEENQSSFKSDEQPTTNNQQLTQDWTVTRRLRVTKGGNYSSHYYINGEPCNASELHEQLNRLRIYPEGYNVVLQGDVTRIITMNSRERRHIIDELAGVAEFDRKIEQVKQTLASVREREERCEIIKEELTRNCERLAADRIKAEKYQKLKLQFQEKQQWEVVLQWRFLQQQEEKLRQQIAAGEREAREIEENLASLESKIAEDEKELAQLNLEVKALGEDEQLAVASSLAKQEAQESQLKQRQQELESTYRSNQGSIERYNQEISQYQQELAQVNQDKTWLVNEELTSVATAREIAQQTLAQSREEANKIASASEAWVQEQTNLSHIISQIQQNLNPQRTEQAQLQERSRQLEDKIGSERELIAESTEEIASKEAEASNLASKLENWEQQIQSLAQQIANREQERQIQQETHHRLSQEQRDKQRQLDKLEATKQAQQEAQGTYATKIILTANLPGVCGLVAQLGQVEPRYQLALEVSAGARLGYIVVEDDGVAAAGIHLLKEKRAGRATFLPLNKIQSPRLPDSMTLRYARGFVDLAVNLIDCEPRYRNIFSYVFGNTVIFANIDDARPHLGKQRIVTLEGEILESSGAMSGGSINKRSSLRFGTAMASESGELDALGRRLQEIELILERCDYTIEQTTAVIKNLSQEVTEARQTRREQQLRQEQLQQGIERLKQQQTQASEQLIHNQQELEIAQNRLQILAQEIPQQESKLQQQQQRLAELEASQTHSEWQQMRQLIQQQEADLREKETALRQGEKRQQDLENQSLRLQEKIQASVQRFEELQHQQQELEVHKTQTSNQLTEIQQEIVATKELLRELVAKLGETKQKRDRAEESLSHLRQKQQQQTWQQEKLTTTQQERQTSLQNLQQQLAKQQAELPNPLPEIPASNDNLSTQLEQLQQELRRLQKRLQAMEPVNMLALEEYERTQTRLQELSEKLSTIAAERTELLLRIENFTTLRFRAFKEAFDAVNENFQSIFATLSQGDGYLQLENAADPFAGGLNLVAHPKGKPVQRLSSMSGGEKSLTALSFIFALQRYRPSPFYAFDEVDMFLDGANVERLAKMIKTQAQQAQFIVVSLRRPMIEAAQRTIGVTQARGAHTQVLGIKL